jgi:hypothetical protein
MPSKKYERFFKPVSRNGFSSSGTNRSQGRVGQTSLSRTGNSCCVGSKSEGKSSMTSKGLILSRVVNPTSVFNPSCDSKCAKPLHKEVAPVSESEHLIYIKDLHFAAEAFCNPNKLPVAVSGSEYIENMLPARHCGPIAGAPKNAPTEGGKTTTD